jgi:hypothetical protein
MRAADSHPGAPLGRHTLASMRPFVSTEARDDLGRLGHSTAGAYSVLLSQPTEMAQERAVSC